MRRKQFISQRADVLLHNSPCFSRIQQHCHDDALKELHFDRQGSTSMFNLLLKFQHATLGAQTPRYIAIHDETRRYKQDKGKEFSKQRGFKAV